MLEYLIIINVVTFLIFGIDKFLAIKKYYRIPESILLGMSLIGGYLGAIIAMILFHHKTKKRRFKIIVFITLALWFVVLGYLK